MPAESRPHGGSAVRARFRHGRLVDLRYAAVSTAKQDPDPQVDALHQVGIPPERVYLDRKFGATTGRPGLAAALA